MVETAIEKELVVKERGLWSIEALAKFLDVSESFIRSRIRRGEIQSVKMGARRMVPDPVVKKLAKMGI